MSRFPRSRAPWTLLAVLVLSASAILLPAGGANASSAASPPFNVQITGPSLLSTNVSGHFFATASGGPAELLNGTVTGNYTFTVSVVGLDTSGSFVSPVGGAFVNQEINVTVGGLNHTGTYTLEFNVTSHGFAHGLGNETQVFSTQFQVVVPYIVATTVQNINTFQVSGSTIRVSLDGAVVGSIGVPTMLPDASVAVKYNYTTLGLSPGYHTFTLTLVTSGGLLQFSNGQQTYSVSFYVQGPAPDYTVYYLTGAGATVLAIFISLLFFGPRRPRRKKNP